MARKNVDDLQPIHQEADAEDAQIDEILLASCLSTALRNGDTVEMTRLLHLAGNAKSLRAAAEAFVPLTQRYED